MSVRLLADYPAPMIKAFVYAVGLTAALAAGGCTADKSQPSSGSANAAAGAPAAGAGAFCARWMKAQEPFLLNTAPEAKAYGKMVADSYQGKPTPDALQVQRAFWKGWADTIRPLVGQGGTPELEAALAAQLKELDRRAAAQKPDLNQRPLASIGRLCLDASGPAAN
ncbi:hypothetical protein AB0J80_06155 [Actinoplanes sp. NPDC049548]|uniref:hypothetical protein n=1 Tax=Actinoplanes sp. NPDC049548 TaxID=3155152 RepID=UPI00341EE431